MTNIRRLFPFVFPLLGFVLIIFAMNGYQYFKLKREVSEGLIRGLGEAELQDLKSFFSDTEEMLLLIRDWGKNDVLFGGGIEPLNKKFIPLLVRQKMIDGVGIAGDSGNEYLIYQSGESFISRYTSGGEEKVQQFSEMDREAVSSRDWQKESSYDPRETAWYENSGSGDRVHWTGVYPLSAMKRSGMTASISWKTEGEKATHVVSAVHLSLSRLESILSAKREERPGQLFLVRPDKSYLTLGAGEKSGQPIVVAETIEKLIARWEEKGQPIKDMVRVRNETDSWVATFYNVGQSDTMFWVGVVAKDRELVGWLDRSLIAVDLVEFFVAIIGGGLILFFMRKNGMIRIGKEKGDRRSRMLDYIGRGEGARVEFKSTIRKNLKSGKIGKEIEFAWLKAVVAFLNSEGGCLLLGVNDIGEVHGLEDDEFENSDRCLLHVKNLLNQYVGLEFAAFIHTSMVEQQEGNVVMVECDSSPDPVFLKVGKNEEFYIRSGPSSVKLSPSQIVNYIQKKS